MLDSAFFIIPLNACAEQGERCDNVTIFFSLPWGRYPQAANASSIIVIGSESDSATSRLRDGSL